MKKNKLNIFLKDVIKNIIFFPISPKITSTICRILNYNGKGSQRISISRINKVLVIRLDEIGDVVMTSPFLRELRRNISDSWISLVVKPSVLNLVENCPYTNEILICDWEGDRDVYRFHRHWKSWRMARNKLRHRKYDMAISPRKGIDQSHGAFLAYFSGAKSRIGYSDNHVHEKIPYYRHNDCLLTKTVNNPIVMHEVESNLELIRIIGGEITSKKLEIWLSNEDEQFANHILVENEIQDHEIIIGIRT